MAGFASHPYRQPGPLVESQLRIAGEPFARELLLGAWLVLAWALLRAAIAVAGRFDFEGALAFGVAAATGAFLATAAPRWATGAPLVRAG